MIFDTDDLGQVIVYLDCIKPYRSNNESSDKGRRLIFKGVGTAIATPFDANDNINFDEFKRLIEYQIENDKFNYKIEVI